ncbi:MAG: aminoacyl-tRNA hydrolase [Deltaproteobacteria bacterium]|nr:aminoacyl-tRNA hydrolase [Deltaproteobacteria bacterium]
MWLIVGLGNPGREYAANRHNAGFMVADLLAERWGVAGFRAKFGGLLADARVGGERVVLLKPQSFMNCSGQVVAPAVRFFDVEPANLVAVHDELDLDFGRIKVKVGGGHGGHNGLRSLFADLGTQDFVRVRLGIGRPPPRMEGADYVLQDFSRAEGKELPFALGDAADAVEMILQAGVTSAMNRFNSKPAEADED